MGGDTLLSALGSVVNALFLVASIYIYISLLRQIGTRQTDPGLEPGRRFGLPEAAVAVALATLFTLNSIGAGSAQIVNLRTRDLIANGIFAAGLVAFITVFLKLRRFDVTELAGLTRVSFRRAIATGLVLMVFAYPLIIFADWLTARVLGSGSSRQGIVELFSSSQLLEQRIIIIVLAVAVAPIAEEFVFRFFLYGVLRRYVGRVLALVLSSLLFAAVHAHLPSFVPLFVLGSCFTLAYEWSGSLLVSMTMHAIFNALTLTALAFPDMVQ
jgi:membrane protease YdiL (CAAX protease family)